MKASVNTSCFMMAVALSILGSTFAFYSPIAPMLTRQISTPGTKNIFTSSRYQSRRRSLHTSPRALAFPDLSSASQALQVILDFSLFFSCKNDIPSLRRSTPAFLGPGPGRSFQPTARGRYHCRCYRRLCRPVLRAVVLLRDARALRAHFPRPLVARQAIRHLQPHPQDLRHRRPTPGQRGECASCAQADARPARTVDPRATRLPHRLPPFSLAPQRPLAPKARRRSCPSSTSSRRRVFSHCCSRWCCSRNGSNRPAANRAGLSRP